MHTFNSSRLVSALALVLGASFGVTVQAQTSDSVAGTKATVTLAFTLTEEIGGFLVKNAQVTTDAAKFITYGNIKNPLGFNAETAGANYYSSKATTKYRAKDTEGQPIDPTDVTVLYSTKSLATKYGNVEFLTDLLNQGIIPKASETATVAQSIKGYSIVAVDLPSPNSESEGDSITYFFVEKTGATPIKIGQVDTEASGILLINSYGRVSVATGTNRVQTAYSKDTATGEFMAGEPKKTYSESSTWTTDVEVGIKRSSEIQVSVGGHAKGGESYNAKQDILIPAAITASLAGSISVETEDSSDDVAVVAGTLSVSAGKYVADLSAYASAVGTP